MSDLAKNIINNMARDFVTGLSPIGHAPTGHEPAVVDLSRMAADLSKLAADFEESGRTLFHPEQYPSGYVKAWEEAHRYCARDIRTLIASWKQS